MTATIIDITCPCGETLHCPDSDAGKKVLCENCLRLVKVPAIQSAPEIEMLDAPQDCRSVREDFFMAHTFKQAPAMSPSIHTPPAPPTQNKNPDKALTNVALGIFRLNNWPCQEAPGYRSFVANVRFSSPQLGVVTTDIFRVCAERGLLMIESKVVDLPELPGVPVLETLNEINQRCVSSVFVLGNEEVVMRHAVIPRPREEGFLTGKMILQVLRQMNHDRRHALSLLRQTIESGQLDPLAIARAFERPVAPCTVPCHTLAQAEDVAVLAGFYAQCHGGQMAVARERLSPAQCPLRITAPGAYLRGMVFLGETPRARSAWKLVPAAIRKLLPGAENSTSILERLNAANRQSGLLRLVCSQRQIAATASLFATDVAPTPEEFKLFADSLLNCAEAKSAPLPLEEPLEIPNL